MAPVVDMLKTWKLVGLCTASAHGTWSYAHWKQSSTSSDGGDGGCSMLHPITPVGAWIDPLAEKERAAILHSVAVDSEFHMSVLHLIFLETSHIGFLHVVFHWRVSRRCVWCTIHIYIFIYVDMKSWFNTNLRGVRLYVFWHCQLLVLRSLVHTWVVL